MDDFSKFCKSGENPCPVLFVIFIHYSEGKFDNFLCHGKFKILKMSLIQNYNFYKITKCKLQNNINWVKR